MWVLTIAMVWTAIALTLCAVTLLLMRRQLVRPEARPPDPLAILDPTRDAEHQPRAPA